MKRGKIKLGIALLVAGLLFTTSCLKDNDYSLNKFWLDYGVLKGQSGSLNIRLDDGTILYPILENQPALTAYTTDRLLVNYTILGNKIENGDTNYIVKVNTLDRLLKKNVTTLTKQNADSLGKDPVETKEFWFGNGFLNVTFAFNQESKIHLINLAKDTIQPTTGVISLLLLHNAWNDNAIYKKNGFVSFDLHSLLNGKDSVKIIVKSKDYAGTSHEFKGTYKKEQ